MEIADLASTGQATLSSALGSEEGGNGEEFNNFLQLLTAQIRNQDPLSPLDSTQFVEQLATFSTLEQQVTSNTNLEGIAQGINDLQSLIANQWLGQTVSVESPNLIFTGEPIEFGFTSTDTADRAVLTVRNSENSVVWSEELDGSEDSHSWSGETASGVTALAGEEYHLSIDLFANSDFLGSVAPRVVTTVTDVSTDENGTPLLGTVDAQDVDLDSVRILES